MDLADLYRDVIVDHNRSPRNFRKLEPCSSHAEGFNPLCGDKLDVYLVVEGDVIKDVAFQGSGCAISVASASLMTEALAGKTVDEAKGLFEEMHEVLSGTDALPDDLTRLGKLAALSGVRQFPTRIKCATLCWHTLNAALAEDGGTVCTE